MTAISAEADADFLIVTTAINLCKEGGKVVVVGNDTDLLVLLVTLASDEDDIYLFYPSKGKTPPTFFDIQSLRGALEDKDMLDILLPLHALSGTDTTSAPFRKGKTKAYQAALRSSALRTQMCIFNDPSATTKEIVEAGEKFLLEIYPGTGKTLDERRYFLYKKAVRGQSLATTFELAVS